MTSVERNNNNLRALNEFVWAAAVAGSKRLGGGRVGAKSRPSPTAARTAGPIRHPRGEVPQW